uniref:Uncharacterized protein n=1 Tax=Magallana gigas TaxID=29159 RepID=A0A8W8KLE6_MAGGI
MKQACVCQGVPIKRKDDGLEVKSGNLFLIQSHQGKCVRIPVHVRVYQSCFEHYAIVNRDGKFANKGIFVNLKNSTCLPGVTHPRASLTLGVPRDPTNAIDADFG